MVSKIEHIEYIISYKDICTKPLEMCFLYIECT